MHAFPVLLSASMAALLVGCAQPTESRPWVKDLEVRGVHNVKERELRRGLATRPAPWYHRSPPKLFDELELERDRTRVQRYYEMNGYYAAKITLSEAKPVGPGGAVDVVIAVEEGAPTFIGDVKVFGVEGLDSTTRKKVGQSQLGLRRGQVFHHADYEQFKSDITRILKKHGYKQTVVEGQVDVSPTQNMATITLTFHATGVPSKEEKERELHEEVPLAAPEGNKS